MSFTLSLVLWLGTTGLYIATDKLESWLHHPYYEFRVWITLIAVLINIFLFYFTSLLEVNNSRAREITFVVGLGMVLVPAGAALAVDVYRRNNFRPYQFDKTRKDLEFLIETRQAEEAVNEQLASTGKIRQERSYAKAKARKVTKFLKSIVEGSYVKLVQNWMRRGEGKKQEKIFKILKGANAEELNYILLHVNVPQLFSYGVYFLRNDSEPNATNTIDLVIKERDSDLSTFSRAAVIHALMRTKTLNFSPMQNSWAVKSFSGCFGEELNLLKNLIDSSGDYNNLFKLVFLDINKGEQRNAILRHIEAEAKEIVELDKLENRKRIKILSDVDDTLYSSGGSFPAGSDDRLPKHVVYPGVLQLFEEIDVFARSAGVSLDAEKRNSVKQMVLEERRVSNLNEDSGLKGIEFNLQTVLDGSGEPSPVADTELEAFLSKIQIDDEVRSGSFALTEKVEPDNRDIEAENHGEKLKISVKLPWKAGGGVEQFLCDPAIEISELRHMVEDQFGLAPWKQNLLIEPVWPDQSNNNWKHGNLVFLSARPNVYKDVSEKQSYSIFQKLMRKGLLHTTPTMLTGSLSSGLAAMVLRAKDNVLAQLMNSFTSVQVTVSKKLRRTKVDAMIERSKLRITNENWKAVAKTKIDRFKKYSLLYPEYRFIFFGDDGQGDVYAAEKVIKYFKQFQTGSTKEKRLMRCFFHRANKKGKESIVFSSLQNPSEEKWNKMGVFFFDTYIGAALLCLESKLISAKGLWRVANRSRDEMLKIIEIYPTKDFTLIIKQLNRDIEAANSALQQVGLDQVVAQISPTDLL